MVEKTIKEILDMYIISGKYKKPIDSSYFTHNVVNKLLYSHILSKYKNKCGKLFLRWCPEYCFQNKHCLDSKIFEKNIKTNYKNGNFCNAYGEEYYKDVIKKIKKCIKKRIYNNIIVHIDMYTSKTESHRNLFIIRPYTKEIIRYEPNGIVNSKWNKIIDIENIAKRIKEKLPEYTFKNVPDFCPIFGFQQMIRNSASDIEKGSCVLWSLLMAELVLLNDNMTFEKIYEEAISILYKNANNNGNVRDNVMYLMRGFFWKLCYEFFQDSGFDIEKAGIIEKAKGAKYKEIFKKYIEERKEEEIKEAQNPSGKCTREKIDKCKQENKFCSPKSGKCISKEYFIKHYSQQERKEEEIKETQNPSGKCTREKIDKCKQENKFCSPKSGKCISKEYFIKHYSQQEREEEEIKETQNPSGKCTREKIDKCKQENKFCSPKSGKCISKEYFIKNYNQQDKEEERKEAQNPPGTWIFNPDTNTIEFLSLRSL
jgi:hypothetical protein